MRRRGSGETGGRGGEGEEGGRIWGAEIGER